MDRMLKGEVGRICFGRLSEDDDVVESIRRSAEENGVKAGVFVLIGALKRVVLGCYKDREYVTTQLDGHLEIASCMGNIALDEKDETIVHAHIVVSNEKCEAFGGHLMKDSRVGPTAELVIIEAHAADLRRVFDEKTKLKLLRLG